MIYVGVAIAALVALLAGYGVWAWIVSRRALGRMASAIDALRALPTREIVYRTPGPGQVIPPAARPAFEDVEREMREKGLTVVGDLIEVASFGGFEPGIERWFRDGDGTTFGWFGVVAAGPAAGTAAMTLFSESDDGRFVVTGRHAPSANLVAPPFLTRLRFDWGAGLAATLDAHRASMTGVGWRRVEDAEAGAASMMRMRAAVARWRAAQPPDQLLEADLRSALADQYDEVGAMLFEFMRARRAHT